MRNFNTDHLPAQTDRIAIVTGANVGLGYETTRFLADKGIKVVMACRNEQKAENARHELLDQIPDAQLEVRLLDLSKLSSVRAFAEAYLHDYDRLDRLDRLINNAGVMMPPYQRTEDGLELQMATNYFGHFLLTGLLLDTLTKTSSARVVVLSSLAHKSANINFDDLQSERKYSAWRAYGQSKLACLMFSYELQRRLERAGHDTIATAAHPGGAHTNLGQHLPQWFEKAVVPIVFPLVTHPPEAAARPTVYAALGEDVRGGDYFGPTGFLEMKGPTGGVASSALSHDRATAERLWRVSEKLTGINYLS